MTDPKSPPACPESEKVTIGALLIQGHRSQDLLEELTEENFADYRNLTSFRAISAARKKTPLAGMAEFKTEMVAAKTWEEGRSGIYFNEAVAAATHAADLQAHIDAVKDKATARKILRVLVDMQGWILNDAMPIEQIVSHFETDIFRAAEMKTRKELITAQQAMKLATDEIDTRASGSSAKPVPTGFRDLDEALAGGSRGGQLLVVGARAGVGKTAMALSLCLNASRAGFPALMYSLEMKAVEFGERLLAMESSVPMNRIRGSHDLDTATVQRLLQAQDGMSAPLFIDDEPSQSFQTLAASARRAVKRHGIKFILIDYLGLMTHVGDRGETTSQKIGNTTRGLKILARTLDVPIVGLSQLNREVDKRADQRPQLSDLRDSGSLEQDADVVMFLWGQPYADGAEIRKVIACLYKQRSGQTGEITLNYRRPVVRFEDYSSSW